MSPEDGDAIDDGEATTIALQLGARIRSLREAAHITQEKLAWRCNVAKSHMSHIEAGKRFPSFPLFFTIAKHLGVHPLDLMCFDLTEPRSALLDAIRQGDALAVRLVLQQFLPSHSKAKNPPR